MNKDELHVSVKNGLHLSEVCRDALECCSRHYYCQSRREMSQKDQIIADLTAAMKARDAALTSTLRMLKSAISYREIEKGSALDDEELSKLLRSQVKQRRDSVDQYQKGGRQ